jgi:hypothetical protein
MAVDTEAFVDPQTPAELKIVCVATCTVHTLLAAHACWLYMSRGCHVTLVCDSACSISHALRARYNNGDTWRNTVVTITQQPNVTAPVVLFESESPYLQYNIQVYVADIGYSPDFCNNQGGGKGVVPQAASIPLGAPVEAK